MSYELAAAVTLIATRCALCGRALLDALSAERGIGPVCWNRAAGEDAPGPADWTAAAAALALAFPVGVPAAWTEALGAEDARRAVNLCTRWIAAEPADARVPHLLAAVSSLGYLRVSSALAEHLVPVVHVAAEGDRLAIALGPTVRFGDETFRAFVAAVRAIPGRRWDGERRANTVPVTSRRELWTALRGVLPPGTVVVGARVAVL